MKLFVTVGAEKRSFDRLIRIIDLNIFSGIFPTDTFIQIGHSSYQPKYCHYCKFLNYYDIEDMIKYAEVVISHAGMGTVILCLKYKKIPILFPRRLVYKEHLDDHQLLFAHTMAKKNIALTAFSSDDLQRIYLNYKTLSKSLISKPKISKNKELCSYLKKILTNSQEIVTKYNGR